MRPHLRANITRYAQKFPAWSARRIYLTVTGKGTCDWTELHPSVGPECSLVEIVRGNAKPQGAWKPNAESPLTLPFVTEPPLNLQKLAAFYRGPDASRFAGQV